MKKHIIAISLAVVMASSSILADDKNKGFDNLEHFGGAIGGVADDGFRKIGDGVEYIAGKTKVWTKDQVEKLKNNICDETKETIKVVEVEVEKIVYRDKIVKVEVPVYIQPKQRRCVTKVHNSRFGDVTETKSCTEWKQAFK